MRKGIVVRINGTSGIVMTSDGQFLSVPRLPQHCGIGDEIDIPASAYMRRHPTFRFALISACTAAVLLIIAFASGLLGTQSVTAAYVTMDINPSIELSIDANQRVIQVEGIDEEGKALLSNLRLKGRTLDEATHLIMLEAERLNYLHPYVEQGRGSIFITGMVTIDSNDVTEESLINTVKSAVQRQLQEQFPEQAETILIAGIPAPTELREVAKNKGISSGKMAIHLLAEEQGYDISAQETVEQSIHHLVEAVGGIDGLLQANGNNSKERLQQLITERKERNQVQTSKEAGNLESKDPGMKNEGSVDQEIRRNQETQSKRNEGNQGAHGRGNEVSRGSQGQELADSRGILGRRNEASRRSQGQGQGSHRSHGIQGLLGQSSNGQGREISRGLQAIQHISSLRNGLSVTKKNKKEQEKAKKAAQERVAERRLKEREKAEQERARAAERRLQEQEKTKKAQERTAKRRLQEQEKAKQERVKATDRLLQRQEKAAQERVAERSQKSKNDRT